MQVKEYLISELIPYENNPRNNDDAVDYVANSIKEFGFKVPVVIDKDRVVVAGHTRILAAKKLKMDKIPCVVADDLTPEQIKAFRLADNKTGEFATWDFEKLEFELGELSDFDMEQFGFDSDEQDEDAEVIQDDVPDVPDDPVTRTGDIYELGDHRLICGDSTDADVLDKLMDGQRAVFVFTDPPYGVAVGSRNKAINEVDPGKGGRIQTDIHGDTMDWDDLYDMLVVAMKNMKEHCDPECSYYVTSPQGGELGMMMAMMQEAGLKVRHMLIWVKNTAAFSMGRLDYDYRHEPIFYTWTDKHIFYGDYSTSVIDDTTPIDKMSKAELKDLVRALKQKKPDSVIYCDKPFKSSLHPTMKPIKLIAHLMTNSSRSGDVVLDVFGGSGSTLIACEQLNRRCCMCEIDPHYCDVIVKRWENLTGKKAKLVSRS